MRHQANFRLRQSALALALGLCFAGHSVAAPKAKLEQLVQQLNQRLQAVEAQNAALAKEVQALRANAQAASTSTVALDNSKLQQRVNALEEQQKLVEQGLNTDTLSEKEPELTARLKAIENQTLAMQKSARKVDGLDGLTASVSLTTVAQKSNRAQEGDQASGSQLNYRGDVNVELPLPNNGSTDQKMVAQFRLGQGRGLNSLPVFAKPNGTAFQLSHSDEAPLMLAQVWYQANIPLPLEGHKPLSKETLEITLGKLDPFVFFDQNAAANDETRQFINSAFVHNPLLDAGGEIGADANGFAPGFRLAYENVSQKPDNYRLSLGVLGAGNGGANYERSLRTPLIIVQAETEQRLNGLPGHARLYAWRHGNAAHFDENITLGEKHSGWGLSLDQRFGDGITAFGRYGHSMSGNLRFDRAVTLGLDFNGSYWDRAADGIGIGLGWLRTSRAYADFSGNAKNERVAELYYRFRMSKQFELTPDFQYISRPGGSNEGAIKVLGLRAQINY
ncbi:MAG: carbohydrate porin [Burkholderiales bacterium]|nr:carbohydrate porin [Burkholderiales bacterium]